MFSTLSRNVVSVASLCWVGFVVAACLAAPALAGNELTALSTPSPAAPRPTAGTIASAVAGLR